MRTVAEILATLEMIANPHNVAGMARFGIRPARPLGISVKTLRAIAAQVKREVKDPAERHALAAGLWSSGIHEARVLASIVDVPALVTAEQMEHWAAGFDSWDIVDQCCGNLFEPSKHGYAKALEWSTRDEEYVRRAGFSLMAYIASHNKALPDDAFEPFFQAILSGSGDGRNFVIKAVNWALRGIGKRNPTLRARAIKVAKEMQTLDARPARWCANDALRELQKK